MKKVIGTLTLLIAIFSAVAPIYVSYDLYEKQKGLIPVRAITLKGSSANDLTSAFQNSSPEINYTLSHNGKPLKTVVTLNETLTNTGTDPILPDDFHVPLTVTIKKPWRILTIENELRKNSTNIEAIWKRKSNNTFEAEPFLFNPDDSLSVSIYITTDEEHYKDHLRRDEQRNIPKLTNWHARIVNLNKIEDERGSLFSSLKKRSSSLDEWPTVIVLLHGHGLLFFTLSTLFLSFLYIYLLKTSLLIKKLNWKGCSLLVIAFMISMSASEVLSYYLFPTIFKVFGDLPPLDITDHIINIFVLFLFITSLSGLLWKSKMFRIDNKTEEIDSPI